jgi:pyridoxine/pyridoxamine 5'-phosphate oxidase
MDDLNAILAEAAGYLTQGATNPGSAWRTPALATIDAAGLPAIRTIVLRRAWPGARTVELHTDARSPKCAALAANPRAALHFWNAEARVQLRLDGAIAVADDAETDTAWNDLPDTSRTTYAVSAAPGTPIGHPGDAAQTLSPAAARAVFTVLHLRFEALEYLSLARGGHKRALFRWPEGVLTATWLVP